MRAKLGTPDTKVNGVPAQLPQDLNWPLFYYHFQRDHAKPDLIWNLRVSQISSPSMLIFAGRSGEFVISLSNRPEMS